VTRVRLPRLSGALWLTLLFASGGCDRPRPAAERPALQVRAPDAAPAIPQRPDARRVESPGRPAPAATVKTTPPKAAPAPRVSATPVRPAERPRAQGPRGPPKQELPRITVLNYGRPVFRGTVDLRASVERILAGERHAHRNDGSVFRNRERRLPRRPRGYYREYVHPTRGVRGAGPQRLIVGRDGDWWYTPDHYKSFVPLQ
jgi:guanyl-specific ribonuclease Sa